MDGEEMKNLEEATKQDGVGLTEGVGVEVPTVGRIVHFYCSDAKLGRREGPLPAIVTKASGDLRPDLKVLSFGSLSDRTSVPHEAQAFGPNGEEISAYWWVWPPRV